jgi:uncharacterized protein
MATGWAEQNGRQYLENETVINVAGLLKEETGSKRTYDLRLTNIPLADDILAPELEGRVRLTKLRGQIEVDGEMEGTAVLECVRCLRPYLQDFEYEFSEPFLQTVDVRSGVELPDSLVEDDDEDRFTINENHEIDLREVASQNALLALPMRPDCGVKCPGPDLAALQRANADDEAEEPTENQFSALSALLVDENDVPGR